VEGHPYLFKTIHRVHVQTGKEQWCEKAKSDSNVRWMAAKKVQGARSWDPEQGGIGFRHINHDDECEREAEMVWKIGWIYQWKGKDTRDGLGGSSMS
jgi:hypothetical protein